MDAHWVRPTMHFKDPQYNHIFPASLARLLDTRYTSQTEQISVGAAVLLRNRPGGSKSVLSHLAVELWNFQCIKISASESLLLSRIRRNLLVALGAVSPPSGVRIEDVW